MCVNRHVYTCISISSYAYTHMFILWYAQDCLHVAQDFCVSYCKYQHPLDVDCTCWNVDHLVVVFAVVSKVVSGTHFMYIHACTYLIHTYYSCKKKSGIKLCTYYTQIYTSEYIYIYDCVCSCVGKQILCIRKDVVANPFKVCFEPLYAYMTLFACLFVTQTSIFVHWLLKMHHQSMLQLCLFTMYTPMGAGIESLSMCPQMCMCGKPFVCMLCG